jgi:hypothetical protein
MNAGRETEAGLEVAALERAAGAGAAFGTPDGSPAGPRESGAGVGDDAPGAGDRRAWGSWGEDASDAAADPGSLLRGAASKARAPRRDRSGRSSADGPDAEDDGGDRETIESIEQRAARAYLDSVARYQAAERGGEPAPAEGAPGESDAPVDPDRAAALSDAHLERYLLAEFYRGRIFDIGFDAPAAAEAEVGGYMDRLTGFSRAKLLDRASRWDGVVPEPVYRNLSGSNDVIVGVR